MSKRKKEIQRRRKPVGDLQDQDDQPVTSLTEDAGSGTDRGVTAGRTGPEGLDQKDSRPAADPKVSKAEKKSGYHKARTDRKPQTDPTGSSWLTRNRENFLLGMLVVYVLLLGLGTVGELFEIEWILNLPLFK